MPEKFPLLPTIEQMGLEVPQEKKEKKRSVPEKFPAPIIKKSKPEALPKKEKKMIRVKKDKEYIQELCRYEGELPNDVWTILEKVFQGRQISEDEMRRLNKVYQKLKNKQEKSIEPEKTEKTPKKKIKNHNYRVPSPKQLFERAGYKIPSPKGLFEKYGYAIPAPEGVEKKWKEKEVGMDVFSTEEQIRIIDDQLANLRERQEQFKKHPEESRQIAGEYRPEVYKRSEELIKEILKLEKERKEKTEQLEREKIELPKDFYDILKTRNQVRLVSLKKEMIEKNPKDIEKIEAIFWFFSLSTKTKKKYEEEELNKIKKELFSVTEKEFLLTQFICANNKNRELLTNFWNICKRINGRVGNSDESFEGNKKGLLGQAAAWHLLKRMGKSPSLALPEEDRNYSIDLWGDKNMAIQVKSAKETLLSKIDKVAFPALFYEDGKTQKVIDTPRQTRARFLLNVEEYKKIKGYDIKAYWLDIGVKDRDDITGEPTEEAVERIRKELEQLEKK